MDRDLTMKKSKFAGRQIAFTWKQAEAGMTVEEVSRKAGISILTYALWAALPLVADFELCCVISCKHLSGVSQNAKMANPYTRASEQNPRAGRSCARIGRRR